MPSFAAANGKTKLVGHLARLIRRHRLDYTQFEAVCLFPESFRLILKAYLAANPDNVYLFESRHRRPYRARRVQQIVQEYAAAAGITERIHPRLFRHQMLTWLTAQGLPDAAIQLISGHSSRKSLEVYQYLSLAQIEPGYQKAVRSLEI